MTDNPAGQLPPEGRLTDDQRARMRAGLMAATHEPVRRPRPWLVPAAAAAAVALVAAGVTVVGLSLADGDGGGEAGPAGQGSGTVEPSETESTVHSSPLPSAIPAPTPTEGPGGQRACDKAVADYLPGATVVAEHSYDDPGTTYLYGNDAQWVVCDTWATTDGGPPTVTGVHDFGSPLSKDLLLVSQNYSMNAGDGAQFFAAGALIPGVRSIQYSFPDGTPGDGGHLVDAVFTDGMWVMQYLLAEPPRRAWTEPVKVAAVFEDGSREEAFLTELDLCAQTNHGC